MAKVNLLTMHYADNNGSFFQTYATCQLLKEQGHTVTLIDLKDKNWAIGRWKHGISYYKLLRYFRFFLCRKRYFPKMTKTMYKINPREIPEADYHIVGSDQVWNHQITYFDYSSYFLSFVPPTATRLSLASSFGIRWDRNETETKLLRDELKKFKAVSVRESDAVNICNDVFGVKAIQVIDPTLAWGDFSSFIKKKNCSPYVCLFTYRSKGYSVDAANYIAETMGWKKIWTNNLSARGFKSGKLFWENPKDWISCIYNSQFFVTDSFHGVAFSLILNKPFIATIASADKISRIESLLKIFGLEDRLVHSLDDLECKYDDLIKPIDWTNINNILMAKQAEFKTFIKVNIN